MSARDDPEAMAAAAAAAAAAATHRSATDAFEVLAKTLALACESKTKGERERAKLIAEPVLKQYLAELDEMQAVLERMEEKSAARDAGGDVDAMET